MFLHSPHVSHWSCAVQRTYLCYILPESKNLLVQAEFSSESKNQLRTVNQLLFLNSYHENTYVNDISPLYWQGLLCRTPLFTISAARFDQGFHLWRPKTASMPFLKWTLFLFSNATLIAILSHKLAGGLVTLDLCLTVYSTQSIPATRLIQLSLSAVASIFLSIVLVSRSQLLYG